MPPHTKHAATCRVTHGTVDSRRIMLKIGKHRTSYHVWDDFSLLAYNYEVTKQKAKGVTAICEDEAFVASVLWSIGVFCIMVSDVQKFAISEMGPWDCVHFTGNIAKLAASFWFVIISIRYFASKNAVGGALEGMMKKQQRLDKALSAISMEIHYTADMAKKSFIVSNELRKSIKSGSMVLLPSNHNLKIPESTFNRSITEDDSL